MYRATTTERTAALLALCLAMGGCAHGFSPGTLRFANVDPVWEVDDTRPVPKPEERPYLEYTNNVEAFFRQPVLYTWKQPKRTLAHNINSLGEVPRSTWFENRSQALSPEDVFHGPPGGDGPDRNGPWTVVSGKSGGAQLGLIMEDASGDRYLLKFDKESRPELESATDVIVSRLLWALGYRVPGDAIVHFTPDDLRIGEAATRENEQGEDVPLTRADLEKIFEKLPQPMPEGGWRALTSRFLPGVPIGGYAMQGVREDDVNDRVPHQHRRDVRAQWVHFGWLKHTDMKEDNTLDMWQEREDGRGYVVHYLVDFGRALGAKGYGGKFSHDGWTHHFDYTYSLASTLTFGLWTRPWEGREPSPLPGVGRFSSEGFRPDRFRTSRPYAAYWYMDRFDGYWAAKNLMRLTPAHIEAAVRAGQLTDSRASEYLLRTLLERQEKVGRYWFARVSPLDGWRLKKGRLCGDDLALRYGLVEPEQSHYQARAYDFDGRSLGAVGVVREGSTLCTGLPEAPEENDGYLIVGVRVTRSGREPLDLFVHLAREGGEGALRIIGVDRR